MDQNLGAKTHTESEDRKRYPKLARVLDRVILWSVLGSVLVIPFLVLPWTMDALELPKQTVFLFLMSIGFVAWLGKAMAERSVQVTRSWLHLVVLVFVLGYGGVSLFSIDRYTSLAGHVGQYPWAFVSLIGFGLFYFLLTQSIREESRFYHALWMFLLSSSVVSLLAILELLGVPIFSWVPSAAGSTTYNSIGNINALGTYITIPILVATSLTVIGARARKSCPHGTFGNVIVWVSLALSVILAVLIDFWVIWVAVLLGAVLLIFLPILRARKMGEAKHMAVPAALVVLSILFLFIRTPFDVGIGSEVSPSWSATWNIARETLQEHPVVGSGPGTWMHDYAKHRSIAVNVSPYWTVRFERGVSSFLTLLATTGLIGISLWLVLLVSGLAKSAAHLITEGSDRRWEMYLPVFVGWGALVFLSFAYNYNFAHHFVFWLLLGLLASLIAQSTLTWDTRKSVVHSASLSLLFVLVLAGVVTGAWLLGQRYVSETRLAGALRLYQGGAPVEDVISKLEASESLNPWNDVALRNLSQAALIDTRNALTSAADDEKGNRVNAAVKRAIEAAKRATEVAPANVANWENFGGVLRAIASFTPGADEQAIAMFQEALNREPNNPSYWNDIGELFILRADAVSTLLSSSDEAVKEDARNRIGEELEAASVALNQSVQAKPDFAPAHYNLGLVYEREGRVPDAIAKLEQVLSTAPDDVGVAFQLGLLYFRNAEKDKAQNLFEQIVAFDPEYSNARWYLSFLYEEQGLYQEAIDQVHEVESRNIGNTAVIERLDQLMALRDGNADAAPVEIPTPVSEEISAPSDAEVTP